MSNFTQFPGTLQNLVPARGTYLLADNGTRAGLIDVGDLITVPGKSFISGHGVPPAGSGNAGDTYMDLVNGNIWNCGPSAWLNSGVSIVLSTAVTEAQQFVFTQLIPLTIWNIVHGLNRHPTVLVMDTAGDIVEGTITFVNLNTVSLSFSIGISGTAYLS